jgi:MFS family permease
LLRSIRIHFPSVSRTRALIGALTLLVATLMLCLDGTRDGDLYLQLASGRFIAAHGLDSVDPFRTIAHGAQWLNQQWLDELLVYGLAGWIGVTGLTVVYAGLLAAPLALLLWLCRGKGLAMMVALAALYCPGLWVIVHPRAAGFSVVGFSLLVAIVVLAWLGRGRDSPPVARLRWAVPATLAVFALWANLHGGFVAGLILIGVVASGLALERRLGFPEALGSRRIGLLALTGVLATGTVLFATPLGSTLVSYLESFRNPAIAAASSEWRPAFQSPLAIGYLAIAAAFAAWLWLRTRRVSRPLTPALVVVAFLALALVSLRNIVFVGPVFALAIASLAPDRRLRIPLPLIGVAVAVSAGAAATWAIAVGPARNEPLLNSRLIEYAVRHPPPSGHIATYAGIGSYMLWRSPTAPVELDGWLEHFTPAELRGTYAVLDGRVTDPTPEVRRLQIGAAIVDRKVAIEALRTHGFRIAFRTPAGAYLVRGEAPRSGKRRPGELGACAAACR